MPDSILAAIGNTPLVRLNRVVVGAPLRVYAKLEASNPGGSIKDRAAAGILIAAYEEGMVGPGTTVVESSSGNMGVGLALTCAYLGMRLICVVDPRTAPQNIRILEAYGAAVDMVTEPDPTTGEFLQARIDRVRHLLRTVEDSFWPNQYANPGNSRAHYCTTMREIDLALSGQIDYLFCATSTCGTIRGCSEYIRECGLKTRVVAVDAVGSVIFGGPKAKRLLPGHGASIRPPLWRPELVDEFVQVSDLECVVGCRRLVRQEGILAGGSSGAGLMAFDRLKDGIPAGSTCVLIFPDRGERYLDTVYSDEWVAEHFGDVSHLWAAREAQPCMAMTF
jgi:N-(2-amino-2-carboxyethyl)-L-glutamate synthase